MKMAALGSPAEAFQSGSQQNAARNPPIVAAAEFSRSMASSNGKRSGSGKRSSRMPLRWRMGSDF